MTSSTVHSTGRVAATSIAYSSVIDATELPRIIRLTDNLYAAAFVMMKLLPARYIVERAEASGAIAPGTPIIETSSGTFGLGLALVCQQRGYPLTIVGDVAIDAELVRRLEMLGARVEIVSEDGHPGGIQGARLDRVEELRQRQPASFVPNQYDNLDNAAAYTVVGDLVNETVGTVDCLVGPVGSGGSTCGIAQALRTDNGALKLIGVDTHGSVIFGLPNGPRLLRGLGSSIYPGNVRYPAYDEVHWVTAAEAFYATHRLYREHGLFMGPTSGASFLAAQWWAAQHPDATVLMVLPDEGHRYQRSVYNDDWLAEHGVLPLSCPIAPDGPVLVTHPHDVPDAWSRLLWERRALAGVLSAGPGR